MAIIAYKKSTFTEPAAISEETYNYYKRELSQNPGLHINPDQESFTGKFKKALIFSAWALPLWALVITWFFFNKDSFLLFPKPSMWTIAALLLIFGFISFVILARLLLEGPSYAVYLRNKQLYFLGIEHAIKKSTSYQDFSAIFYGGFKVGARYYKSNGLEALAINKPSSNLESTLIVIFRIIDRLTVIFGVIIIGYLIWRFFFKK